jgi:hypothetical protein
MVLGEGCKRRNHSEKRRRRNSAQEGWLPVSGELKQESAKTPSAIFRMIVNPHNLCNIILDLLGCVSPVGNFSLTNDIILDFT